MQIGSPMYSVSKVYSEDQRHSTWVLEDTETCMPVLHPTLFMLSKSGHAQSTHEKDLRAISFFYTFWERKFGHSFCYSLIANKYDLSEPISELENFFDWLCTKQHLDDIPLDETVHHINSAPTKFKQTNAKRVQVVARFFKYLISHYITLKYQDLSVKECRKIRQDYRDELAEYEKELKLLLKQGGKGTGTYSVYKSIPDLMRRAIIVISTPSTPSRPNNRNPFKHKDEWMQQFIQLRNDLMIRLYFNYGLRRGELLLLDIDSVKMSAPTPSGEVKYLLAVTSLDDDYIDPRSYEPSIKTAYSHRVLSLTKRDYTHLKGFINQYRAKLFDDDIENHKVLFTSSQSPYKPISVSRIKDIFNILDGTITKHYPDFRNTAIYESLPRLTPKVARHTWAYEMLKYNYAKEYDASIKIAAHTGGEFIGEKQIMENVVDSLRNLGGWSDYSDMPRNYGKRFFAEQANQKNIRRVNEDAKKVKDELESIIETEKTEDIFYAF